MRNKKIIRIGDVEIGGNLPILIQSMCNTKTEDVSATVDQILKLEDAGCEIVRLAVPTFEAASAIAEIKKRVHIPLVADIHFDYRLAIEAIKNGIDKVRINPGNIGNIERVRKVVNSAKERQIPIRIGINSGSIERKLIDKYGGPMPMAMLESMQNHIKILEDLNFDDIVMSVKSSDVLLNNEAYQLIDKHMNYPIHLGLTEPGSLRYGIVKSAVGIGSLLLNGIGDTVRVSLTADPVHEIDTARQILSSLRLRVFGVNIVSCPTCGRTNVNLEKVVAEVEDALKKESLDITVAVMGCEVNGPGEAKHADIGIAGGKGVFTIFKHGKLVKRVEESNAVSELLKEIEIIKKERELGTEN